jgi:hypothetical protein
MFVLEETVFEKKHRATYIDGIKHFIDPNIMYKFGFTKEFDALNRFTKKFLKKNNYKNEAPSEDFKVEAPWTAFFPLDVAKALEERFEANFPKNIWTTKRYTGCTEYRYIPALQASRFIDKLNELYPKSEYGYKPGYYKVYFTKFTRKDLNESKFED